MVGVGASSGIGIGKAVIFLEKPLVIEKRTIEDSTKELARLEKAIEKAEVQLKSIAEETRQKMGDHEAEIFEAHQMMLRDPEWIQTIENHVKDQHKVIEWAVQQATTSFVEMLEALDDPYLKARSNDLKDVSERVLRILLNVEKMRLDQLPEGSILITDDLKPSDSVGLCPERIEGIITSEGSETSHSAIIARTLGIPAVMGISDVLKHVQAGDAIVLNGSTGDVVVNPGSDIENTYRIQKQNESVFKEKLEVYRNRPTQTADGKPVELVCNIGRPDDAESIIQHDGEGVGLFRSEFIFIDRDQAPDEDEQYKAYTQVLTNLSGKPVIIRTMDAGGDKEVPYLNLPKEMNPFLGFRAVRISLERQGLFKTQIRAILRASVHGTVKIMIPMISTVDEVLQVKTLINQCQQELQEQGVPFSREIEIGIMIEVPSAAFHAEALAKHVDFFSIGTNDLIQYTMAADRMNASVRYLYKPTQPAVVKMIHHVIKAGHKAGIWVGMCGEAAAHPMMIPLLIGMGLDEFSVSPASVLKTRWQIHHMETASSKILVEEVLTQETADAIEECIHRYLNERKINTV